MDTIFSIVICDDDNIFTKKLHNQISDIILKNGYNCDINIVYNGTELISYCSKYDVDIIFADIDMPEMSGFEAIERLQRQNSHFEVIFVTAHSELAYQAYEYQPFCFVSKMDLTRLSRVLLKLLNNIIIKKDENDIIRLRLDDNIYINTHDVIYLDTCKNYVVAHCRYGSDFSFRATIKEVYEHLCNNYFILIQRGYIVNCRFIDVLTNRYIILRNKEKMTMTRDIKKITEAEKIYKEYMRRGI